MLEDAYYEIIKSIGEDPDREGLVKTPKRAADAIRYLTSGYQANVETILNGAVFTENYEDMVVVKDIEFYSLCEHHLLPFYGRCHIGYIPSGKIVGISKIARLVEVFARRLQVQERMTMQIADVMEEALSPLGVAVVIKARHLCMLARGVEKQNSKVITSEVRGSFRTDRRTRIEFMDLISLQNEID
ncbi:MAG: GTP cyclohydrolase I FolE [bacterium]